MEQLSAVRVLADAETSDFFSRAAAFSICCGANSRESMRCGASSRRKEELLLKRCPQAQCEC